MKLLDLFCGAGGAAMGYYRAGFTDITGIDNRPQKHYPFNFIQADALEYLTEHGAEYDVIHASPPCQAFTDLRHMPNAKNHISLIEPTRDRLIGMALPWIIENVEGAPLRAPILLCGTMFGLVTKTGRAELWRHRLFETNFPILLTPQCNHRQMPKVCGVYGGHGRDRRRVITVIDHSGGSSKRDGCQQFTTEQRREAMGIDWMTGAELSQAIPPAYTEWTGLQLLARLDIMAK